MSDMIHQHRMDETLKVNIHTPRRARQDILRQSPSGIEGHAETADLNTMQQCLEPDPGRYSVNRPGTPDESHRMA